LPVNPSLGIRFQPDRCCRSITGFDAFEQSADLIFFFEVIGDSIRKLMVAGPGT
jgi:hypothetical protein